MKVLSEDQKMRIRRNIKKYAVPSDEVFKKYESDPNHRRYIETKIKYYDTLRTLRKAREAKSLTQKELAEQSGVPRTTISKIESGRRNTTIETLMALAGAMGKQLEVRLM